MSSKEPRELIVEKLKRTSPPIDKPPNFAPFKHHLYLELLENPKKVKKGGEWKPPHKPSGPVTLSPSEIYPDGKKPIVSTKNTKSNTKNSITSASNGKSQDKKSKGKKNRDKDNNKSKDVLDDLVIGKKKKPKEIVLEIVDDEEPDPDEDEEEEDEDEEEEEEDDDEEEEDGDDEENEEEEDEKEEKEKKEGLASSEKETKKEDPTSKLTEHEKRRLNMTPEERIKDEKLEYIWKWRSLKKTWPDYFEKKKEEGILFPEYGDFDDLEEMKTNYDLTLKDIMLDHNVETYERYLMGASMIFEMFVAPFFNLDMQGYAAFNMKY